MKLVFFGFVFWSCLSLADARDDEIFGKEVAPQTTETPKSINTQNIIEGMSVGARLENTIQYDHVQNEQLGDGTFSNNLYVDPYLDARLGKSGRAFVRGRLAENLLIDTNQ